MEDDQIMKNIAIKENDLYKGKIYYDTKEKKFVQIRETITNSPVRDGFVCSDFVEYYDSAKTVVINQRLNEEYITRNLIAIDLSNSHLFYHDGIGWRCRDKED